MKRLTFLLVALLRVVPASAQLVEPNQIGLRMGHVHLAVKDVDAQKAFWTNVMGGTIVKNGPPKGIHIEAPIRTPQGSTAKVAFLTDPWGTYIELTQGLAP